MVLLYFLSNLMQLNANFGKEEIILIYIYLYKLTLCP